MALANLAAGQVAIDWGLKGATSCVVTACAAGSNAIGEAFHRIRDGYEDVMLAGGSEAAITPLAIAGFSQCVLYILEMMPKEPAFLLINREVVLSWVKAPES